MILLDEQPRVLKSQVAAVMAREPRTLLKPLVVLGGAGVGATLGATRMNNLRMIWTRPDNRERQARGHGLI
jgi:hypothetical protein